MYIAFYYCLKFKPEFPQKQLPNDSPLQGNSSKKNNQPMYSDYEPALNRNPSEDKKTNFNPTFQPSVDHYESSNNRESRDFNHQPDDRQRKNNYGDELRNQIKQNEFKKQQEKNEIRLSRQANNSKII